MGGYIYYPVFTHIPGSKSLALQEGKYIMAGIFHFAMSLIWMEKQESGHILRFRRGHGAETTQ